MTAKAALPRHFDAKLRGWIYNKEKNEAGNFDARAASWSSVQINFAKW